MAQETKASYEARAKDFWAGTRGHDVSQNIAALLRHIEAKPPLTILDLGCGPGRDLKIFSESGHTAIGVEGVAAFAAHAREYSGCDVWEQDLLRLELPAAHFDGIFANAVLFHVPTQELTRVLSELHTALKPGGVLFASNPHGHNEEGWTRGRYGAFLDHDTWRAHAAAAGFTELEHYYRPTGAPREQQPWLATVFRRSDPGVSAAA
ncbi:MAG: class I SAM-dependent methyltransferase [Betaproteobacteria bacterium]